MEWKNIPGICIINLQKSSEGWEIWHPKENAKELSKQIQTSRLIRFLNESDGDYADLTIYFISNCYYLPMSMYGGCQQIGWSGECDEEIIINEAELSIVWDKEDWTIRLLPELQPKLFEELAEIFMDTIEKYGVRQWPESKINN